MAKKVKGRETLASDQSSRSLPRSFESSGAEQIAEEILLGNCNFVFLLTMKMINQFCLRAMLLKMTYFISVQGWKRCKKDTTHLRTGGVKDKVQTKQKLKGLMRLSFYFVIKS